MSDEQAAAIAALDEAIATCGGVGAFATAIGENQSTVSNWRKRGSVPASACPAIYRETVKRGKPVFPKRFQPTIDWDALRQPVVGTDLPAHVATGSDGARIEKRSDHALAAKIPAAVDRRVVMRERKRAEWD